MHLLFVMYLYLLGEPISIKITSNAFIILQLFEQLHLLLKNLVIYGYIIFLAYFLDL
jgi:hypothetical protein